MSYDSTILADSPVSVWWQADPSGTTAADSADSNPGTYTGGFTLGGAAPFPGMDGSTAFNGTTGYVSVPDATNLHVTSSGFSVEAWIKTSVTTGQVVICKFGGSPNPGFAITLNVSGSKSGVPSFWVGDATAGWLDATASVADGLWHHLVGTLSGTAAKLYVDGVQVASGTRTSSLSNTSILTIGRWSTLVAGGFFNGSISSAAVYGSVLSPTQVAAHTWASVGTLTLGTLAKPVAPALQSAWTSGLLAAYNLGEGSSTAADLSGNAHTGTLTGGCTWSSGAYGNHIALADNGTTGSYLAMGSLTALASVTEWTFSALCQLATYTDSPRAGNLRVLIGTSRVGSAFPQSAISYNAATQSIHFGIRYNNFADIIAPAPPLNQWVLITGRVTAAHEASLWYDGVKVAATTNASYAHAGDVTPTGALGDMPASQTGNNWSGPIAMGLFATRGYTDAEIIALAADPFVWDRVPNPFGNAPLLIGF